MATFTNTEFKGRYPVGTAAVIVAKDAARAAVLLRRKLKSIGLPTSGVKAKDMIRVYNVGESVKILLDGNY